MPRTSDPALGTRLERDGYAVVRLIDAASAAALRQWWLAEDDGLGPQPFRSSIMSPDVAHRRRAHQVVTDALLPAAARLLPGFRPCLGSFTVKLPGGRARFSCIRTGHSPTKAAAGPSASGARCRISAPAMAVSKCSPAAISCGAAGAAPARTARWRRMRRGCVLHWSHYH